MKKSRLIVSLVAVGIFTLVGTPQTNLQSQAVIKVSIQDATVNTDVTSKYLKTPITQQVYNDTDFYVDTDGVAVLQVGGESLYLEFTEEIVDLIEFTDVTDDSAILVIGNRNISVSNEIHTSIENYIKG